MISPRQLAASVLLVGFVTSPLYAQVQYNRKVDSIAIIPSEDAISTSDLLKLGDVIIVILRPAPGALPELPGFRDNDSISMKIPFPCPWDLTGDGTVNTSDMLELFAQWGTAGPADFDESGAVGTPDLLTLFANWGSCP